MSVALQMVLAIQGLSLTSLPSGINVTSRADCVSRCFYKRICLSIFYDSSNNMCHLVDTEYHVNELLTVSSSMEYFVWDEGICRSGYSWNQLTKRCYKTYNAKKTWHDAENQCVADGGHLVKVDTTQVSDFMKQIAVAHGRQVWLGGNDESVEGTWIWADNTDVETTLWGESEPNGGDLENCMMTTNYVVGSVWMDVSCSTKKMFVCQVPVNACV